MGCFCAVSSLLDPIGMSQIHSGTYQTRKYVNLCEPSASTLLHRFRNEHHQLVGQSQEDFMKEVASEVFLLQQNFSYGVF